MYTSPHDVVKRIPLFFSHHSQPLQLCGPSFVDTVDAIFLEVYCVYPVAFFDASYDSANVMLFVIAKEQHVVDGKNA